MTERISSNEFKQTAQREDNIHLHVCQYLKAQYPDVIFVSDGSGVPMHKVTAIRISKLKARRGIPDLIVLEPKHGFHALFIELKSNKSKAFKKDGTLKADEHLAEQEQTMLILKNKGYACYFGCGFDESKKIIDWYLAK